MERIFVTGMGVITAIGNTVAENQAALSEGRCGIGKASLVDSRYADSLPFGEVPVATEQLKEILGADRADLTRTSLLALHACNEAIAAAGLTLEQLTAADTALVGGTTVGGMCLTDELYRDANNDEHGSAFLASYDCAATNLFLQDHYGISGIVNTINTACSSSANAILYGARLIRHGLARRVIVGGFDSLAKFTINGFKSLYILSEALCQPFDQDRKGLNLGEGAAFLILEREQDLDGKKVYAELTGYGNANDAFHPSSLSEEGNGPYLSMKAALDTAQLQPSDIGYINAHGTGTENNDVCESRAMLRLFGTPPPFTSTKSNVGHTLGAAGAVEAVYSILSLQQQEIYPQLRFENAIPGKELIPERHITSRPFRHVMSNSFGFAGNCSSLIFSKA